VKIRGVLISIIRFANYIVLLATFENDLQTALIEMDDIFLIFKLNINTTKTKVMVYS